MSQALSPVQMFWHGAALSRLERLCISSFLAHGHAVHLYIYQEPAGVPRGVELLDANSILAQRYLFLDVKKRSVATFADWFRYRLLYEKGGLWADTDVVCLQPLRRTTPEVFAWQDQSFINNAVLGFAPAHPLPQWMAQACEHPNRWLPYDDARRRWRKLLRFAFGGDRRSNIRFGEYGPDGLTQAARHLGYADRALPFWHFYPIHYLHWRTVFDLSLAANPQIVAASTTLHLWNEMTRREPGFDKNARFPPESLYEHLCRRYLTNDN